VQTSIEESKSQKRKNTPGYPISEEFVKMRKLFFASNTTKMDLTDKIGEWKSCVQHPHQNQRNYLLTSN